MEKSVDQTLDRWEQMMQEDKARREREKRLENKIIAAFFSIELFICFCIILWTQFKR